jgi:hypothetical protein
MIEHIHSCPICDQEREPRDCPDVGETEGCWEPCPQHREQWQDQASCRPGAFEA